MSFFPRFTDSEPASDRFLDLQRLFFFLLSVVLTGLALNYAKDVLPGLLAEPGPARAAFMQRFVPEVPSAPKPVERALYVLGVSLFALLIFLFASRGNRIAAHRLQPSKRKAITFLHLIAYWGIIPFVIAKAASLMFKYDEYMRLNFFAQHPIAGAIITLAIFFCINPATRLYSSRFKLIFIIVPYALSLFMIIPFFTIPETSIDHNAIFTLHLNAYISSIVDAFQGMTISKDYVSQYGLYAHFLETVFKIFNLSFLSFTVTMTILIALLLFLLFKYLLESTNNYIIALLGYSSTLLYTYFIIRINFSSLDPYYQVFPHRHIFPCSMVYLSWRYFKGHSKFTYYLTMAIASIAPLWNPDTGIMIVLAWIASLVFIETSQDFSLDGIRKGLAHILRFIPIFFMVVAVYSLLIKITHGTYPDLLAVRAYLGDISKAGFTLLPMPLIDPWNSLILIYAVSIAGYLIGKGHRNSPVWQSRLFIAFLGLGIFTYYEGRSHHYNLINISFPGIVLLASLTSDLWQDIVAKRFSRLPAFLVLLFLLASSPATLASANSITFFTSVWNRLLNVPRDSPVLANARFIAAHAKPDDKVLILSDLNWFYHMRTGYPRPIKVPNFAEQLYVRDRQAVADAIGRKEMNKVFIDWHFLSNASNSWALDQLEKNYTFTESSHDLCMAIPGASDSIPDTDIHQNSPDVLREYQGIGQCGLLFFDTVHGKRVTLQEPPIPLGSSFSIEAVLIPAPDQRRYACILSNHPGTGYQGFVIQQDEDHTNVYGFGYGDGQKWLPNVKFALQPNVLNDLAIVNDKGHITVYINGTKTTETNAGGDMADSHMRLTLGNWDSLDRKFNGSIKRITILSRPLTENEIADHWEKAKAQGK